MKKKRDDKELAVPSLLVIGTVGAFILDVWLINFVASLNESLFGDRGSFGDAFGASNALFSGLALAGVFYAVLLQRADIKIAREDLTRTKEIFEEQSRSFRLQNDETKKQIFESTFFQLLRVFTELTNNLDLVGDKLTKGKDVFSIFEKRFARIEDGLKMKVTNPDYHQIFGQLYSENQNDLGHYFRMLYTVLKYIDQSSVESKKFYTNILRAQLSNPELHLLLYNGLSTHGREKLKPLLERYELFDNLPFDKVKYPEALKGYSVEAYGANSSILNKLTP